MEGSEFGVLAYGNRAKSAALLTFRRGAMVDNAMSTNREVERQTFQHPEKKGVCVCVSEFTVTEYCNVLTITHTQKHRYISTCMRRYG